MEMGRAIPPEQPSSSRPVASAQKELKEIARAAEMQSRRYGFVWKGR
jgi:hypothetical protein